MNFQQLRIIRETVRRNFNLTEVANALYTSQSGVSKHIRDLEDELGVELFVRARQAAARPHRPRQRRWWRSSSACWSIPPTSSGWASSSAIASRARSSSPPRIRRRATCLPTWWPQFRQAYPKVRLTLHQGSPTEIATMVSDGDADIGICTETAARGADADRPSRSTAGTTG